MVELAEVAELLLVLMFAHTSVVFAVILRPLVRFLRVDSLDLLVVVLRETRLMAEKRPATE
ncbi:MAG: hypothetical protein ACO32I_04350 [Candidatus Limnocylindrus sp.]